MLNVNAPERTLVASFTHRLDAERALTRLLGIGFSEDEAWLVARDGFGEEELASAPVSHELAPEHKQGGFVAFIERLFGMDPEVTTSPKGISPDSERYLSNSYHSEQTLLIVSAKPGRLIDARAILQAEGALIDEEANELINRDVSSSRGVRLHAEELIPHTEKVEASEVVLRKAVITETQTIEVPVSHEELVIERRPLTGEPAELGSTIAANAGEEVAMRLRLMEEQVVVEKRTVPTEEILVSKREVKGTKTVSDQVKHEEARIEQQVNPAIATAKTKMPPEKRPLV